MTELITTDNTNPLDLDQDETLGIYDLSIMFRKQALVHSANNNKSEMEKNYLLAIETSDDLCSMINVGIYYEERKQFDLAKQYYLKAIELYADIDAMYNLGDLYRHKKDYQNMKKYFKMAIARGPDGYAGDAKNGSQSLGDIMYCLGKHYQCIEDNYERAQIFYKLAVEQCEHKEALFRLAWYYDEVAPDWQLAKDYYDRYILANNFDKPTCIAMYNIAINSDNLGDKQTMLVYLNLSVEKCQDIDAMHYLAHYYQSIEDHDNMRKFYLMAVEADASSTFNINKTKTLPPFTMMGILKSVENPGPQIVRYMAKLERLSPEIMVYTNKFKLFTQLGHVVECGICYDQKLNINLNCGHCVCLDCYPHVYDKSCPFCRM